MIGPFSAVPRLGNAVLDEWLAREITTALFGDASLLAWGGVPLRRDPWTGPYWSHLAWVLGSRLSFAVLEADSFLVQYGGDVAYLPSKERSVVIRPRAAGYWVNLTVEGPVALRLRVTAPRVAELGQTFGRPESPILIRVPRIDRRAVPFLHIAGSFWSKFTMSNFPWIFSTLEASWQGRHQASGGVETDYPDTTLDDLQHPTNLEYGRDPMNAWEFESMLRSLHSDTLMRSFGHLLSRTTAAITVAEAAMATLGAQVMSDMLLAATVRALFNELPDFLVPGKNVDPAEVEGLS